MARSFMLYLPSDICEWHYSNNDSGRPFSFAPGCMIARSAIAAGDAVYGVNVVVGTLFVIGRMTVERVLTGYEDARRELGEDAWHMPEHLLAAEGSGTPMYFSRQLPWELTMKLRVKDADGKEHPLPMLNDEEIDSRALREVRELTEDSAAVLDVFLTEAFEELIEDAGDEEMESLFIDGEEDFDEAEYVSEEYDEDEDDLTDEQLSAIATDFEDAEQYGAVMETANGIVTDYFQGEGYRVTAPDDSDAYYDLRCTRDDEEFHILVYGTPQEELRFLMADADLEAVSEDDYALVCVITHADSDEPELSIFDPDALLDDFLYRPLQWGFLYAGDDEEDDEDGSEGVDEDEN